VRGYSALKPAERCRTLAIDAVQLGRTARGMSWLAQGPMVAGTLMAGLALFPLLSTSDFQLSRIEMALIILMGALSLNLAFGYGGKLALGQPLLITVAAYTAGILSKRWQFELWQTLPFAVLASILANLLLGLPGFRVRGWYLAVIAFLAVSIVPSVVLALPDLTGGSDGLTGIRPIEFSTLGPAAGWVTYEIVLAAAFLCWFAMRNIASSAWGIALRLSRDHPVAATATGISNLRLWLWIYILSAVPCGLAGALFAHSQQFVSSENFGSTTILLFIGSVFLGGPGTLWGPVLGVAIFEGLTLYFGEFSPYNPLALGIGVLLAALLFRGGIIRNINLLANKMLPPRNIGLHLTTAELPTLSNVPAGSVSIAAKHIGKQFGGNVVLSDVGLDLRGGEILAVVGPNGSGKTTLLNVLSGFIVPDYGEVVINGESISKQSAYRRARAGVGRTFQVPKLVPGMTVVDNTEAGVLGTKMPSMAAAIFRLPGFKQGELFRRRRALEACRAVGFDVQTAALEVGVLPLGLKRMVEIARILAAGATVACFDEPVAGLNLDEQRQVADIARKLADSGRAVLLIEHNLPFVLSVCDRVLLLVDGAVVDIGSPSATTDLARPLGRYFQTFAKRAEDVISESVRDEKTSNPSRQSRRTATQEPAGD
jgi:branched-chain amino acid transport system permease protein